MRDSIEEKGFSMRMLSQQNQAVADTLNIANEELRLNTISKVN